MQMSMAYYNASVFENGNNFRDHGSNPGEVDFEGYIDTLFRLPY